MDGKVSEEIGYNGAKLAFNIELDQSLMMAGSCM